MAINFGENRLIDLGEEGFEKGVGLKIEDVDCSELLSIYNFYGQLQTWLIPRTRLLKYYIKSRA